MKLDYSFTRYLAAKKSVDDRALNRHVQSTLITDLGRQHKATILEIGAGIGTMVERLHGQGILSKGMRYTAIDSDRASIAVARRRLQPLQQPLALELEAIDLYDFVQREAGKHTWDFIIAHAFLDLVDLETTLKQIFTLLAPGGAFYFTINFDGVTILQPVIDRQFDEHILALYHQTMDQRLVNGQPSGDSRTGRKLFAQLHAAGGELVAAGSSDWVVFAGADGYAADEAYFLHFIIHTIDGALRGRPELDQDYFAAWIAQRHAQIEARTLVLIAHQLDFYGRRAATP